MALERRFDLYSSDARVNYTLLVDQNTMLKGALGSSKVLDRISRNPDLSNPIWRVGAGQVITATSLYLFNRDPQIAVASSDVEGMESIMHFLAQTGREAVIRGFIRFTDISPATCEEDLRAYFAEYEIPAEQRSRSARTFAFFYAATARMLDRDRENYGSIAAQMTGLDKEDGAVLTELIIPDEAVIREPQKIIRAEKAQKFARDILSQLSKVRNGRLVIERVKRPDGERTAEKALLYNMLISLLMAEFAERQGTSQIAGEIIQLAVSAGWLEEGKAQLLTAIKDVNALEVLRDGSVAELEALFS